MLARGESEEGEKAGDQETEIVAGGVADDADGETGDKDAPVLHGGGHHGDEGRGADEGDTGNDHGVRVDL